MPYVPSHYKLRTEDGKCVRLQETSLAESLHMYHQYATADRLCFDYCTGSSVSVLSMLHLGFKGIVNDRDKEAISLGIARARCYLDYLYKEAKFKYPALGVPHKTVHDGTDLYAWIPQTLNCTERQMQWTEKNSGVLILPPTNTPHNVKKTMTDTEFGQVRFGVGLCGHLWTMIILTTVTCVCETVLCVKGSCCA